MKHTNILCTSKKNKYSKSNHDTTPQRYLHKGHKSITPASLHFKISFNSSKGLDKLPFYVAPPQKQSVTYTFGWFLLQVSVNSQYLPKKKKWNCFTNITFCPTILFPCQVRRYLFEDILSSE